MNKEVSLLGDVVRRSSRRQEVGRRPIVYAKEVMDRPSRGGHLDIHDIAYLKSILSLQHTGLLLIKMIFGPHMRFVTK